MLKKDTGGGHGLDFSGLKCTPDRGFCEHNNTSEISQKLQDILSRRWTVILSKAALHGVT